MAQLLEKDQVGKRQSILDLVTNRTVTETPFTSMLAKTPEPKQTKIDYQVESYPDTASDGILDGADVTTKEHVARLEVSARTQKFRQTWGVSDFSDESEVAGLPTKKGEKGTQRLKALQILRFQIEERLLSYADCQVDNGTLVNRTRGALLWLDPAAQATYPVPAAYRPAAGLQHTTALSTLTEEVFGDMLELAAEDLSGGGDWDLIAGPKLKRHVDNWTIKTDGGSANETLPMRQFNQNANDRKIISVVDFLETSSGRVRLHTSYRLAKDTSDGTKTNFTPRSGILIDMRMWAIAIKRAARLVDLEDRGGGPNGFADAILALLCKNPLGQASVYTDT